MIKTRLTIENPWAKDHKSKNLFDKHLSITENKHLETELTWFGWSTLFELIIDLTWMGYDHAGPKIEITLLGLFFSINLYDTRHWNYEKNRWYLYGEEDDEY